MIDDVPYSKGLSQQGISRRLNGFYDNATGFIPNYYDAYLYGTYVDLAIFNIYWKVTRLIRENPQEEMYKERLIQFVQWCANHVLITPGEPDVDDNQNNASKEFTIDSLQKFDANIFSKSTRATNYSSKLYELTRDINSLRQQLKTDASDEPVDVSSLPYPLFVVSFKWAAKSVTIPGYSMNVEDTIDMFLDPIDSKLYKFITSTQEQNRASLTIDCIDDVNKMWREFYMSLNQTFIDNTHLLTNSSIRKISAYINLYGTHVDISDKNLDASKRLSNIDKQFFKSPSNDSDGLSYYIAQGFEYNSIIPQTSSNAKMSSDGDALENFSMTFELYQPFQSPFRAETDGMRSRYTSRDLLTSKNRYRHSSIGQDGYKAEADYDLMIRYALNESLTTNIGGGNYDATFNDTLIHSQSNFTQLLKEFGFNPNL